MRQHHRGRRHGLFTWDNSLEESHPRHLILFTRVPEVGTTKTGLIRHLGPDGAANLQRKMTEHALSQATSAKMSQHLKLVVRYEGESQAQLENWLGSSFQYRAQGPGNIGDRIKRAFFRAFRNGAETVVIIRTDIPEVTDKIIEKAFFALSYQHLVLGPAKNHDLYLIGLRKDVISKSMSSLFDHREPGSDNIFEETVTWARREKLEFLCLPCLANVDRPEDLAVWEEVSVGKAKMTRSPRISIIIPTLNEVDNIEATIRSARSTGRHEIIVVDGGSDDGTPALAKRLGAKVIKSDPPRAHQLNQGAIEANGDVLVFLHADTRLPQEYATPILQQISRPSFKAGAFGLRIDSSRPGLRFIERLVDFRSRCFHLPYGDQALFFTASTFYRAGGFPLIPIMEDFALIRSLRKVGKIVILKESVRTSARRWKKLGVLKTTLINQLVIVAYLLGVSPQRIVRWYRPSVRASLPIRDASGAQPKMPDE